MFGIFDGVTRSVENAIDLGIGVVTLGEYGDFSKKSVSKMVADGIEIAVIADFYSVGVELVEEIMDED